MDGEITNLVGLNFSIALLDVCKTLYNSLYVKNTAQ